MQKKVPPGAIKGLNLAQRRYDCAGYSICLRQAATRNYMGDLCEGCDRYEPLIISEGYRDQVISTARGDYIVYEM